MTHVELLVVKGRMGDGYWIHDSFQKLVDYMNDRYPDWVESGYPKSQERYNEILANYGAHIRAFYLKEDGQEGFIIDFPNKESMMEFVLAWS